MSVNRYQELRPAQFDAAIREMPVCYVPIGSLEWHGEHLPLGVDSLRASMILEAACERFGGVVYPPIYSGIPDEVNWDLTRYPYDGNVMITEGAFRLLIETLTAKLKTVGFCGIFLLTGHHPRSQPTVLREIAQQLSDDTCRIWGDCDPALGGLYKGDHAGFGETSMLLFGRPELVEVDQLRQRGDHGVSKDPDKTPQAFRASAEDGRKFIDSAVAQIGAILDEWQLRRGA